MESMEEIQQKDIEGRPPLVSIVSPCFNEEGVIRLFLKELLPVLQKLGFRYEIVFVNDGSTDRTLEVLLEVQKQEPAIRILNLSRNFGKEAALTAGLEHARGDAVIAIDVDMQHPVETIEAFVKKWEEGFDVVVGKRLSRTGEHPLKKASAKLFYHIHGKISDINLPSDVGDFRLMDRKVIETLKTLPENQRFMKGIFAWMGYKTAVVEYYQEERAAGVSSFNGWKLWNFAIDGITSFSTVPLRIWLYVGFVISMLSFLLGIALIIEVMIQGIEVPGYVSTITMVLFLGGIQLIGIGILGEYIGRIYKEAKRRPTYIIEREY